MGSRPRSRWSPGGSVTFEFDGLGAIEVYGEWSHPATSAQLMIPSLSTKEESVEAIHTDDAPPHTGPVPQAVVADGWIFVSALFGADPVDHAIPADVTAEGEQIFDNLVAILSAAGASLTDAVRVGIVMRDLQRDRPAFNKIWTRRFGEHRPARSAIQSAEFGRKGENARIMIEVTAYRG